MATSTPNDQLAAAALAPLPQGAPAQTADKPAAEKHSYGQILKSSTVVGGSSVLNIAIGIVRTKAVAMLLGPAGFGLAGLYSSVSDLTQNIAGMGINSSGVRQIAEAAGSDDKARIGRTTAVLRRTSILLGALGAVLLIVFSRQASVLTFGKRDHAAAICLLSIAVFFRLVSGGQGALIQGMRRIGDLAKVSVLGALFGTLITIPVVYFLRERGIVPSLVGVAAMMMLTSWWYSRKIRISIPPISAVQVGQEAAALLKLGFAFMSSGLMTLGVAYAVRITLLRKVGFAGAGLYQSAWTLGGLYVGFILQAMAADFYPRLTAAARDNAQCNRLVNEQARVGLLLAGPGVIATLTFAPAVIALFYSAKFGAAVEVLRWICLGTALQVITWPMGFIIIAKGNQNLFLLSEVAWAVVSLGLMWVLISAFGLDGAGIAFFTSYVFHGFMTYPMVRWLSGFRWSRENKPTISLFLSLMAVVFCSFHVLPFFLAVCVGTLAVALSSAYSLRVILTLISSDLIPRPMRRLILGFGFAPSSSTTVN
jgi:PST family polysaccharide transporter